MPHQHLRRLSRQQWRQCQHCRAGSAVCGTHCGPRYLSRAPLHVPPVLNAMCSVCDDWSRHSTTAGSLARACCTCVALKKMKIIWIVAEGTGCRLGYSAGPLGAAEQSSTQEDTSRGGQGGSGRAGAGRSNACQAMGWRVARQQQRQNCGTPARAHGPAPGHQGQGTRVRAPGPGHLCQGVLMETAARPGPVGPAVQNLPCWAIMACCMLAKAARCGGRKPDC